MPGRSRQGESVAPQEAAGERAETEPAASRRGRAKKRGPQAANGADGVVFAIYTHAQERERYRALAERLKVTHGELLTLLLDMTEDLLEREQLEVRFTTVTVRKTRPEYVLKVPKVGEK